LLRGNITVLNNKSAKVVLLTGKIASGKSYYAERYVQHNQAIILSCDDLFLALFDDCLGENHQQMEKRAYTFFCNQAVQLVRLGIEVLLDFGFWTTASRMTACSFFKKQGIETEIWFFETDDMIRKSRLEERNKLHRAAANERREYIIDNDMLEKFDSWYQPPDETEDVKYISM